MKRPSDATALTAVLAWERCQEMADRSKDECIRAAWLRDGEAAWAIVQRWLGKPPGTLTAGKQTQDKRDG